MNTTKTTTNHTIAAYRIPTLIALAFECGSHVIGCELVFEFVDAALASERIEVIETIRDMVARVCHWIADSGIEYGTADEECLLGYLDALSDAAASIKLRGAA